MAYKKYSEIKVGVFVLIAIVVVIATIFWAKGFIIGQSEENLTVYFRSVNNVNKGDPVAVKGVKLGRIEDIILVGDSVKIEFTVDKSVRIKKDYKIEIAIGELTGGNQLYIDPGKDPVEIDYSQPLYGDPGTSFNDVMKMVTDLQSEVKGLIAKFSNNSDKLNEVLISVNDLVSDPQMKMDLKSTISNFEVTSRNLNSLVSENRTNLNSITNKVGRTVDNVNTLVDETSPEFKRTFENIQVMTNRVDSLIGNLNMIVTDVKEQRAGLGKFIYDEKFFRNINTTLEEVERLTRQIRKDGVKINLF